MRFETLSAVTVRFGRQMPTFRRKILPATSLHRRQSRASEAGRQVSPYWSYSWLSPFAAGSNSVSWNPQGLYREWVSLVLHQTYSFFYGPGSSVGIATTLRAGRSGDRISVGARFSAPGPDRPWSPPSLLYNEYRVFPGGKVRPGRAADNSPPSIAMVKKE